MERKNMTPFRRALYRIAWIQVYTWITWIKLKIRIRYWRASAIQRKLLLALEIAKKYPDSFASALRNRP